MSTLQIFQRATSINQKLKLINRSSSIKCWKLVHDGKNVICLLNSSGLLETKHILFCATTEKEVQDEISRLNLEITKNTVIRK